MTIQRGDISQTNAAIHLGLASQLVQDLRDMRAGITLDRGPEFERRLQNFKDFVDKAGNAAIPVFKEREGATESTGRLSPARIARWATLDSDQEPFALVQTYYGDDPSPEAVKSWTDRTGRVMEQLETDGWEALEPGEKDFVEKKIEPFLERLERLDESPAIRSRGRGRNATAA